MNNIVMTLLLLIVLRGWAQQVDTVAETGEQMAYERVSSEIQFLQASHESSREIVRELCRLAARSESRQEKIVFYESAFRIYVEDKRLDDAYDLLQTLRNAVPDFPLNRFVGLIENRVPAEFLRTGRFAYVLELARVRLACENKIDALSAKVQADPQNKELGLELAYCYVVLEKWTSAMEVFERLPQTAFSRVVYRREDGWWYDDERFFGDWLSVVEAAKRPYRDFILHHMAMIRDVAKKEWKVEEDVEREIGSVKTAFRVLGFGKEDWDWTVRARMKRQQKHNVDNLGGALRNGYFSDSLPEEYCWGITNHTARTYLPIVLDAHRTYLPIVLDAQDVSCRWEQSSPSAQSERTIARAILEELSRGNKLSDLAPSLEVNPLNDSLLVDPSTAFIRIRSQAESWEFEDIPWLVDLDTHKSGSALLRMPWFDERGSRFVMPALGLSFPWKDDAGGFQWRVPVALEPETDYCLYLQYDQSWYRYSFRTKRGDTQDSIPKRLLGRIERLLLNGDEDEVVCPFAIDQVDWEMLMESNPSIPKDRNLSVSNVSFEDCLEYVRRLNSLSFSKQYGVEVRIPSLDELQRSSGNSRYLPAMACEKFDYRWTWTTNRLGDAHLLCSTGGPRKNELRIARPASFKAPYTGLRLVVKAGPKALAWLRGEDDEGK